MVRPQDRATYPRSFGVQRSSARTLATQIVQSVEVFKDGDTAQTRGNDGEDCQTRLVTEILKNLNIEAELSMMVPHTQVMRHIGEVP